MLLQLSISFPLLLLMFKVQENYCEKMSKTEKQGGPIMCPSALLQRQTWWSVHCSDLSVTSIFISNHVKNDQGRILSFTRCFLELWNQKGKISAPSCIVMPQVHFPCKLQNRQKSANGTHGQLLLNPLN